MYGTDDEGALSLHLRDIETCPACGCEAERVARLVRGDEVIGYVDSCGARVVRGCLVGNN